MTERPPMPVDPAPWISPAPTGVTGTHTPPVALNPGLQETVPEAVADAEGDDVEELVVTCVLVDDDDAPGENVWVVVPDDEGEKDAVLVPLEVSAVDAVCVSVRDDLTANSWTPRKTVDVAHGKILPGVLTMLPRA